MIIVQNLFLWSKHKKWGRAVVNHLLCLASANTDNLDAIVRKLVPSWAWNWVTMWYRTVDMNWVLTYVTVFEVEGEKRNVFYSVWITVFGRDWKGLLVNNHSGRLFLMSTQWSPRSALAILVFHYQQGLNRCTAEPGGRNIFALRVPFGTPHGQLFCPGTPGHHPAPVSPCPFIPALPSPWPSATPPWG